MSPERGAFNGACAWPTTFFGANVWARPRHLLGSGGLLCLDAAISMSFHMSAYRRVAVPGEMGLIGSTSNVGQSTECGCLQTNLGISRMVPLKEAWRTLWSGHKVSMSSTDWSNVCSSGDKYMKSTLVAHLQVFSIVFPHRWAAMVWMSLNPADSRTSNAATSCSPKLKSPATTRNPVE